MNYCRKIDSYYTVNYSTCINWYVRFSYRRIYRSLSIFISDGIIFSSIIIRLFQVIRLFVPRNNLHFKKYWSYKTCWMHCTTRFIVCYHEFYARSLHFILTSICNISLFITYYCFLLLYTFLFIRIYLLYLFYFDINTSCW